MTRKGRKARKGFVLFVVFRLFRGPKHRRGEIDALVCELYGLTREEIKIAEESN